MDVEIKHGTISGYKYRACRCQLCRKASVRYEKGRRWLVHQGLMPTVPALGFKRRVRALMAIGWTQKEIAAELGIAQGNLALKLRTNETVRRATHETAAEVYERLCMTVRTSVVARRTARIALKNGWPPPLAWDDIDTDEEPRPGAVRCHVGDCPEPARSRSYCDKHYRRWLRSGGDPLGVGKGRPRASTATYNAVHLRLNADQGKARDHKCVDCEGQARTWSYDHGDPEELVDQRGRPYSLNQQHYAPRCTTCHNALDRRHAQRRRDLLAEWHDLRDAGESIEQAALRLGVTVGAIERAEFRRQEKERAA